MLLLILISLFPLFLCQIDYSQLLKSFGPGGFPMLDPKQADVSKFYRTQEKPVVKGIPINFNSVIHNVKTAPLANQLEIWTNPTSLPSFQQQAPVRRQRQWPRTYSYDAYEGGRTSGGYYTDDDGYEDGPPPRPRRPRPRRPPPPKQRYGRPDECCEGYGRSPPGSEEGIRGDGEGSKTDTVKIGSDGKGTISSDSDGLLSSLAKSLGGEGTKNGGKDKGKNSGEGTKADAKRGNAPKPDKNGEIPLEDVKNSANTRAPEAARTAKPPTDSDSSEGTREEEHGYHKTRKGKGKRNNRHKIKIREEDSDEEDDDPLEIVDGEVKVPKRVDGETRNSEEDEDEEEEEEIKHKKKKSKKGRSHKKKHRKEEDSEEEDDEEDQDEEEDKSEENEDKDEEDCLSTTTPMTATTEESSCENEKEVDEQTKGRNGKKKQLKSRKKDKKNKKKEKFKCPLKKKKTKCGNKETTTEGRTDERHVNRHDRSEADLLENAINATELTLTTESGAGPPGLDCSSEKDEYPSKCGAWKSAGYCETNQATQFLWCRKTCLCPSRVRRAPFGPLFFR